MTPVLALIGSLGLYLLFLWLLSAIAASWLAVRKGYPERWGIAAGLILLPLGVLLWLVWPARPESPWRQQGPLPPRKGRA